MAAFGDVFEVPTPCGYAYVQYTHQHPEYGSLIRVLRGLYPHRPPDLAALVTDRERFFVFYPIKLAAKDGVATQVGNYPVPSAARPFPLMRMANMGGTGWYILADGTSEVARVGELTPEQQSLPRVELWPHPVLLTRLASNWSWADESDELDPLPPAMPCHDIGVPWPMLRDFGEDESDAARHCAYFPTREPALEAKRRVASLAERVMVTPAADPVDGWLLTAVERKDDSGGLEDALVEAAAQLGGEYDGTERRLG